MLHAVIMAGGSGTRFWPESRHRRPKQLLPILGGQPLVAETAARVRPLIPAERTWVVTHQDQAEGIRAACPDLPTDQVIVEPCARNTAACVALAAATVLESDPEATLAVLPADHLISPNEEFQASLAAGACAAEEARALVTFGIRPSYPATGYGYIRQGARIDSTAKLAVHKVERFVEKPDAEVAQCYLDEGCFLWNAGIFVWQAKTILQAFEEHLPELAKGVQAIMAATPAERPSKTAEIYPNLESLPVDIGILERHDTVRVLEAPYHWSDIGSWRALYDEVETDSARNAAILPAGGELLAEEAEGVLAYSRNKKTIAVLGLNDLVVVDTEDALLVAPRERAEEVKRFVERLKAEGKTELL